MLSPLKKGGDLDQPSQAWPWEISLGHVTEQGKGRWKREVALS